MSSHLPLFWCLFLSYQLRKKPTKNGSAVTSLRSFLFRDDFSDNLINDSSVGTETVTAYCVPQIAILRIKMRSFEVPEASFQQNLLLS